MGSKAAGRVGFCDSVFSGKNAFNNQVAILQKVSKAKAGSQSLRTTAEE